VNVFPVEQETWASELTRYLADFPEGMQASALLSYGEAADAAWLNCERHVDRLRTLSDGWSGEGSEAVPAAIADTALAVLRWLRDNHYPVPTVTPSPAGTIIFAWETGDLYMESEVVGPNHVDWYVFRNGRVIAHGTEEWESVETERDLGAQLWDQHSHRSEEHGATLLVG
jgi:hypothetical protein